MKNLGFHNRSINCYVDDVVTSDNAAEIQNLKAFLANEFLGPLRYFIGIEAARSNKGIFISQWKYVLVEGRKNWGQILERL